MVIGEPVFTLCGVIDMFLMVTFAPLSSVNKTDDVLENPKACNVNLPTYVLFTRFTVLKLSGTVSGVWLMGPDDTDAA